MRTKGLVLTGILLFVLACFSFAQEEMELKFLKKRISERVMTLSALTENSRVVAISTKKGLVMIDSMWSPSIAQEAKKIISKEFGRSDFVYLINTNDGDLGSRGNQAFPEAVIVAHEECRKGLLSKKATLSRDLEGRADEFHERVVRSQKRLKESNTKDPGLQNWIDLCERIEADMRKGYEIVLPFLTFKDRLSLDMGDLTIELIYFGKTGSNGDTIVKVPEEGFIFLGDIFHAWHTLPYTHHSRREMGVERWLSVFDVLLKDKKDIRFISRSNGSDGWLVERLEQHGDLIHDIQRGLEKAEAERMGLTEALAELSPVEEKFPYIKNWDTFKNLGTNLIEADVSRIAKFLWQQSHNSAAFEIAKVLNEEGIAAAQNRLSEIKEKSKGEYYFLENEFNSEAYELLYNNKLNEAIAVFKMNVELFPESANVYDSLGEAYMRNGNTKLAVKNYRKSLELNPENNNAREMLKKLEKK